MKRNTYLILCNAILYLQVITDVLQRLNMKAFMTINGACKEVKLWFLCLSKCLLQNVVRWHKFRLANKMMKLLTIK